MNDHVLGLFVIFEALVRFEMRQLGIKGTMTDVIRQPQPSCQALAVGRLAPTAVPSKEQTHVNGGTASLKGGLKEDTEHQAMRVSLLTFHVRICREYELSRLLTLITF